MSDLDRWILQQLRNPNLWAVAITLALLGWVVLVSFLLAFA